MSIRISDTYVGSTRSLAAACEEEEESPSFSSLGSGVEISLPRPWLPLATTRPADADAVRAVLRDGVLVELLAPW
jgi:hypothetical protein